MTPTHRMIGVTAASIGAMIASGACAQDAAVAQQAQSPSQAASSAGTSPALNTSTNDGQIADIVVTAQKRSESANSVPMSITAVGGERLAQLGITDVRSLERIIPGFQFTEGSFAAPVYSIRGIGFNDSTLGSRATVSVYVDENPLPFSIVTRGAALDLERVEVLKGPQGTLFGQNATGGAINYIAAKPTRDFRAGLDFDLSSYSTVNIGGFASGPLTSTLSARVAFRTEHSDGWQESQTRSNDRLGTVNFNEGRLILLWQPTEKLTVTANLNGYVDRSETLGVQYVSFQPLTPAAAGLGTGPALANSPRALSDNRLVDWTPGQDYRRNNRMYQGSLRVDYDLSSQIILTSLSSYLHYDHGNNLVDYDGTAVKSSQTNINGAIRSFFQEIRLTGTMDRFRWIVGVNYANDIARENDVTFTDVTSSYTLAPFVAKFTDGGLLSHQLFRTTSVFADGEFQVTDSVKVFAGVRYTDARDRYNGCSISTGDNNLGLGLSGVYSFLRSFSKLGPVIIPLGGCLSADAAFLPGELRTNLNQQNVPWRAGVEWQPQRGTLFYATVSKGYKAGSFPVVNAVSQSQLAPAVQEALQSYEVGTKLSLFDRSVQLNAAVFRYDYDNKQVRGRTPPLVPFGALEALVNVPKSRINGAELSVTWLPVRGLTLTGGATYLDSRVVGSFINYTPLGGGPFDFSGERLPLTPMWQAQGDAEYRRPLSQKITGFVGLSANYHSKTEGAFGAEPRYTPDATDFDIRAYTLMDARVGLEGPGGVWRVSVWSRNITNQYYWSNAFKGADTVVRSPGLPRTIGATASFRFG